MTEPRRFVVLRAGRRRVNPMAASDGRGQEEDGIKRFDPRILDPSVIAIPLLEEIR